MGEKKSSSRNSAVDGAKTVAIFGTLLIHASAAGGFAGAVGSFDWVSALAWNCLVRSAVPLFLLCSGALLLPPQKNVTIASVWKKYIPRILAALLFWAAAYAAFDLLLMWRRGEGVTAAMLGDMLRNLLLFNHKSHLYYLHITLLVYALLPVTRSFVAKAEQKTLYYALGVWFILSSVYPTLRAVSPLGRLYGIPAQYVINLSWGAVGLGVLGYVLTKDAAKRRPREFALLYLLSTAVTFGGTWIASLKAGALYDVFLQGNAPFVYLQAVSIYGFFVSSMQNKQGKRWLETVSRASFCIYLVHLFFLDYLTSHGFAAGIYSPIWAVPALVFALFLGGFAAWLWLRRIPIVNRWLI
ncbi:MAG: acyltransferase family protein [Oscillospiraceae bacterium]|nr:acyltransferase family protein [Oscillospiraceae bacterium]